MSTERLTVTILETRENAIKVSAYGSEQWLPRSQIESMKQTGDRAEIIIPYWLFKSKFGD